MTTNTRIITDEELNVVVGGFLGSVIQNTKMHALHLEPNPTGQDRNYVLVDPVKFQHHGPG